MDKMKYVVIHERLGTTPDGTFIDRDCIYIFQPNIFHRDFASKLAPRSRWRSGGFVGTNTDGNHYCYGKSESMNMSSRPEDNVLLNILLGE